MDLKTTLLTIYSNIRAGRPEGCYEQLEAAKQDPAIIPTVIEIINEQSDNYFKQQASILLKNIVKHSDEELPVEAKQEMATNILQILNNPQTFEIQSLLAETIDDLNLEGTSPMFLEFAQQQLESGDESKILASILLMQIGDDTLFGETEFITNLIQAGVQLSNPVPAYELCFTFGSARCQSEMGDGEEDGADPSEAEWFPFFTTMFEQCLTAAIEAAGNESMFNKLMTAINYIVDDEDAAFVDGQLIFNHFFPLIGNSDVPTARQVAFANTINIALDKTNLTDVINESELTQSVIDQFFEMAALIYEENPGNHLELSNLDVLEDFCSSMNVNDDFIQLIIEKTTACFEEERYMPAATLSLAFCFTGKADDYSEQLDEIVPIITTVAENENQLARDCAAEAIYQFSDVFEGLLEDYLEQLATACINSFTMQEEGDISNNFIRALNELFTMSANTDPVFEGSYQFLTEMIDEVEPTIKMQVFECLVTLCSHSSESIVQEFDQIYEMMSTIISSESEETANLIPSAIDCLRTLSVSAQSQFMAHIEEYAAFLVQLIENEDSDIVVAALQAIGAAATKYPEVFLQSIDEVAPKLLELGEKDTNEKLAQETAERIERLRALEEGKTVEIEIDEDETGDEDKAQKPYMIPALALCSLCGILSKAPAEALAAYADAILERCDAQLSAVSEDALARTCRALALFAELVGKAGLNAEAYSAALIDKAVGLIKSSGSEFVVTSAVEVFESVLNFIPRAAISEESMGKIMEIVQSFLSGEATVSIRSQEEQVLEDFSKLMQNLITVFEQGAVEAIGSIIPQLMEYLTGSKALFKAFSLPILGTFVEFDGEHMEEETLTTIYITAKGLILTKNDPTAVFVINQFVSGAPAVVHADLEEISQLLFTKLAQPAKKAEQYKMFICRIASVIGEFQRVYWGDEFDPSSCVVQILQNIPSTFDESENLGLARFYVWLANKTGTQPSDEFLAAGVRTLQMSDEEIGESLIADPVFEQFKGVVGTLIQALPDQSVITTLCGGDELKAQRVISFFQQ